MPLNPPFLEGYAPAPGSTGAAADTFVEVDLVDAYSFVDVLTIDAYVDAGAGFAHVYDGYADTFFPPYDGPASALTFIAAGSVDGYDAYNLLLDRTTDYPLGALVSVRIVADDYEGNMLDGAWAFTINNAPFLEGYAPAPGDTSVPLNTLVEVDIVDAETSVDSLTIDAYVDDGSGETHAYDGYTSTFFPPYDGGLSSLVFAPGGSIDGYDAYQLTLDRTTNYPNNTLITARVIARDSYGALMDGSWSFATPLNLPPFPDNRNPAPAAVAVPIGALVSFNVLDSTSDILQVTLDAYVEGALAYDGSLDVFLPPYNGAGSSITPISTGSGDGYAIVIDKTVDYTNNTIIPIRIVAEDSVGNFLDETWSFTTVTVNAPFIRNKTPAPNSNGNDPDTLISLDILDRDGDLDLSTISITVEGATAFASSGFSSPFTGPNSAATVTTVDGYDGYHFIVDSNDLFSDIVVVRVFAADFTGNSVTDQWSFLIGTDTVRTLYFSDGYGVKKINVRELVGESQDKVRTTLSTATSPALPDDKISSISGRFVGSDFFLAVSMDGYGSGDGYGAVVVKNEVDDVRIHADGYHVKNAQLTDRGTLYLVNRSMNRVEVFYGAHFRDGYRAPDFIYDGNSTPPILSGAILDLHVAPGESLAYDGGSRLYVGTATGLSRIEAYDLDNPDGYSGGQDGYGISITYGIPGSGADHEVLGGTAPQVVSVHSDETFEVLLVATDDGYGNGGLTQVSLSGNRQISFLTEDENTLPSDRIRNVFGRKI